MDFMCYQCHKNFINLDIVIDHLKIIHRIKDGNGDLQCVVKRNPPCTKKYGSIKSLRRHAQECVKKKSDCIAPDEREICLPNAEAESNDFFVPHVDITHDIISSNINEEFAFGIETNVQNIDEFMKIFFNNIIKLNLTYKATNEIFTISEKLLEYVNLFMVEELKRNTEMDAVDIVKLVFDCVANKIHKLNSAPKRDVLFRSDMNFVQPEAKTAGVHWEMQRNKKSEQMLPTQVQSKFQYVPIMKTLISKFDQPEFRDLYVNYNFGRKYSKSEVMKKHICKPDQYKDFCCGKVFEENKLFAIEPKSIQIQLFIDGFNVCDPLKSSSKIHDQVGIYFSIKNLPKEHAYNMNNIHLVALCHSIDLKNKFADYNNLWDEIVKDVSKLETVGLCVNKDIPCLKGKNT